MLSRTPALGNVVKTVKFSEASKDWLRRHRRGLESPTPLCDFEAPPVIPPLASVLSVELDAMSSAITMTVAHLALFPNLKKLHFQNMWFSLVQLTNILGACRPLITLSFHMTSMDFEDEEYDSDSEDPSRGNSDSDVDSGDEAHQFQRVEQKRP
jgi:hypothetical protein